MRHVLVCSDLSDGSRSAIARAARIAARAGGTLTVCTAVDDDLPHGPAAQRSEEARALLAAACAELSVAGAEIAVQIGEPAAVVGEVADRVKADLVVLGTHRHRPLRDLAGRTTMERIVGASRRAVLLVAGPVSGPYARVLGGVDGSPASAAALRLARDLAPGADFRTFHAVEVPARGWFGGGEQAGTAPEVAEAEARIGAWWPAADLPEDVTRPEFLPMPLQEAFRRMRYDVAPDLVAIGAHGRPGAAPGRLGAFAQAVLRWQFCDTLIVRTPGETAAAAP